MSTGNLHNQYKSFEQNISQKTGMYVKLLIAMYD
jgi:hypothetical protein